MGAEDDRKHGLMTDSGTRTILTTEETGSSGIFSQNAAGKYGGKERYQRRIFLVLVLVSFLAIGIFNHLTPMFSDDYTYGAEVRQAQNLMELVQQEYHQYLTWNGRSVVHLLLRISLSLPETVFKTANSAAFVILTLLIYANIRGKRTCDSRILLFATLLVWLFGVDFAQTVLWQTGACNYLWGTTLILGMLTLSREEYHRRNSGKAQNIQKPGLVLTKAVLFALYGLVAGWCNENTSGALVLVLLVLNGSLWFRHHRFSAPLLGGLAGSCVGFSFMILAPGNAGRATYSEENYSGLAGYAARFEKLVVVIEEYFFPLLCLFVALLVIRLLQLRQQERKERWQVVRRPFAWVLLSLVTSFALVLAPSPMPRANFGAGIFLIIGICQITVDVVNAERRENTAIWVRSAVYSLLAVLCLHFVFVYVEDGTNLFRIHRDCMERVAYINEQKAAGSDSVTVAQVHPAFYNRYSAIDIMDLKEDPAYWTNVGFEQYFGIREIRAVPYDEWSADYKGQ